MTHGLDNVHVNMIF